MESLVQIEVAWAAQGDTARLDRLSATQPNAAIAALPFYPWLSVKVESLAAHPSDPHPKPGEPR